LQEVFEAEFYSKLKLPKKELAADLEKFYDEVFPLLASVTAPAPEARIIVKWAIARGYRIAIATDPFFPEKATYHRLRWAGFDPDQFELISTFEHFHFSKTHPAYYAEVLGRLGWPEGPVLMVGDNLDRDILPAQKLGLATYHVNGDSAAGSGLEAEARGDLGNLPSWLESADLDMLNPSFKTPESILAVLLASPAALSGLAADMNPSDWARQPAPDEWALIEVISHLRDTEREIHHMQIRLFDEQAEPFIPRPDTNVWASQRNYLNEYCPSAVKEFTLARMETFAMLNDTADADWGRKARHAIFGPTNFLEVSGFMADHDRLHIQQAWKIVNHQY
jgi:FMN phosphatase YigB (HAD superfamily)